MILSIESATDKSSVAIHDKGQLIGLIELHLNKSHSGSLTVMIDQLLENCQILKSDLNAIAVSIGPGSYTGLRIGISTGKGLSYALDIPLIAIETLDIMAAQAIETHPDSINEKLLFCPMIDARRMEVYAAMYDINMRRIFDPKPVIIDNDSFNDFIENKQVLIFGNGAAKCGSVLSKDVFKEIRGIYPSAKYVGILAYNKLLKNDFIDLAYLEPLYLKAYRAKLPKKNRLLS